MIKTKYFQTIRLTDTGKRRIQSIASLSDACLETLASWVSTLTVLPISVVRASQELSKNTGCSAETMNDSIAIALDILPKLSDYNDSPSDFADDAHSTGILKSDTECQVLKSFLEKTFPYAKHLSQLKKIKAAKDEGAPLLQSVDLTVALKPVFDNCFKYGEDKITEYKPSIVALAPVVQAEFFLTNQESSIAFQMCDDTLDRLISDLLAIQAQLKISQTVVSKLTA